jgi:hypothetical protein
VVEIYENARDGITPDLCWAGSTEWHMGRKLYWLFENGPNRILLNPEQVFPTQTLDENATGLWNARNHQTAADESAYALVFPITACHRHCGHGRLPSTELGAVV